jgi:hypothetical protein
MSCDGSALGRRMRSMGMVDFLVDLTVDGSQIQPDEQTRTRTRTHRETSGQTCRRQTCVSRTGVRLTALETCRAIKCCGAWGHSDFHVGDVGSVGTILRPPDIACSLHFDPCGQHSSSSQRHSSPIAPTTRADVGESMTPVKQFVLAVAMAIFTRRRPQ